jgi:hypothetical protein
MMDARRRRHLPCSPVLTGLPTPSPEDELERARTDRPVVRGDREVVPVARAGERHPMHRRGATNGRRAGLKLRSPAPADEAEQHRILARWECRLSRLRDSDS